jgi:fructosamine-3-kinase
MSFHESDISWQVLRQIVQGWVGTSAELAEVQPLEGGMINTTLCLTLKDGQRCVLKISPHRINRDYEREVQQLDLLRSVGLPVPQVYCLDIGSLEDPHSYILMEFVDGVDLAQARQQCSPDQYDQLQHHLAELVGLLHSQTSDSYRRVSSNDGGAFQSWPAFYRHVFDPIVHDVEKNHEIPPRARKQMRKVHDHLDRLISHADCPRLVHWDIWATNLLARPDPSGCWRICAVLDPNCKYAHAEAEIAYLDLFHTSTPAFLKTYQSKHRLDDGYHRVRKAIYQLYPLINDVHLYGHDYVKPLLAALDKTSELV